MKCPILKNNLQTLKISKYFNVLSASFEDPFHENTVCIWCFLSFSKSSMWMLLLEKSKDWKFWNYLQAVL